MMDLFSDMPNLLAWAAAKPKDPRNVCRKASSGVCSVATARRVQRKFVGKRKVVEKAFYIQ